MSVNGKFKEIMKSDLMAVADRFQVPRAKAVLKEVTEAVAAWPEFAKQAGVPEKIAAAIRADHLQRRV